MASQLGTITLTGKSGSTYSFNILERSTTFKKCGVVYVQSKTNSEGKYVIIYIGQTGDLSDRPLNHHKIECFDQHGADKLLLRTEENEKRRLEIEADLIDYYNPPCNG